MLVVLLVFVGCIASKSSKQQQY